MHKMDKKFLIDNQSGATAEINNKKKDSLKPSFKQSY